ncbi:MAG: hypothetical protein RL751_82 [Bacteroidota bacterium]|jgi:hypothetical protein
MQQKRYLHNAILLCFIAVLGLVLAPCSKIYKVKVKYVNKTGSDLKGLVIGGKRIGKLDNNAETKYLAYNAYHFDSGLPDEAAEAKIDDQKVGSYSQFFWCGTEKYKVEEGTFEIQIQKVVEQDKVYLYLAKM